MTENKWKNGDIRLSKLGNWIVGSIVSSIISMISLIATYHILNPVISGTLFVLWCISFFVIIPLSQYDSVGNRPWYIWTILTLTCASYLEFIFKTAKAMLMDTGLVESMFEVVGEKTKQQKQKRTEEGFLEEYLSGRHEWELETETLRKMANRDN